MHSPYGVSKLPCGSFGGVMSVWADIWWGEEPAGAGWCRHCQFTFCCCWAIRHIRNSGSFFPSVHVCKWKDVKCLQGSYTLSLPLCSSVSPLAVTKKWDKNKTVWAECISVQRDHAKPCTAFRPCLGTAYGSWVKRPYKGGCCTQQVPLAQWKSLP